jgi:hypothetical protein
MAPTPSEVAAKAANIVTSTSSSAKDFKKEKTTARVLGAGTYYGNSSLGTQLTLDRMRRYRRAYGLPPR